MHRGKLTYIVCIVNMFLISCYSVYRGKLIDIVFYLNFKLCDYKVINIIIVNLIVFEFFDRFYFRFFESIIKLSDTKVSDT